MKEKFPTFYRTFNWLFKNWTKIAEVLIIVWAVNGIMDEYYSGSIWGRGGEGYHIVPVLAYFFSAALILYLLRRYERKD